MHSHITIPGSLILVTVFMQVKKYLRNPVVDFVFDLGIHLKTTKKKVVSLQKDYSWIIGQEIKQGSARRQ